MKHILTIFLVCFCYNIASAATYYISPTGNDSNNGLSIEAPLATFAHAQTHLIPGDNLILMDGTYTEALNVTITGTTGNQITFQAQNRGMAIIEPSTANNSLSIRSSDGNKIEYITVDGIIFRGNGNYSTVIVGHIANLAAEADMGGHYILKNIGAFGSNNLTNGAVVAIGQATDVLVEDAFAYGFGRKAFQTYGSLRLTVRRFVARYDFWDGDLYNKNDPRIGFGIYNSHDGLYENIISLDNAPDPTAALTIDGVARNSASKAAFALEGNVSTTVAILGAQDNIIKGILGINTYGNGLGSGNGIYSSGVSTGQNSGNTIVDAIFAGNAGSGYNFLNQTINNSVSYMTSMNNSRYGLYIGSSAVTGNIFSQFVVKSNTLEGVRNNAGEVNTISTYSSLLNDSEAAIESDYSPTLDYIISPVMVVGHERGGSMRYRYVDGTLTSTSLWPWPNEDLIRQHMCNSTDLATVHRVATNGAGWEPAWCASGKSLTRYVWEYLGNTTPAWVYGVKYGRSTASGNFSIR